ncbi:MAG: rod shape-determining protein MreD [Clostridiales Family XIII bacterium]|jgi:rod shape-determining protein MreD|nr:rod shape-determining protein MreD [Clostridiales Family XIII bacterium]
MRLRYAIPIFLAAFVIQSTMLRYIAVYDVAPNVLLCLVIVFAFLYEEPFGLVFGVIFGILRDIEFGLYVGISAVSQMAAALLVMRIKRYLNHELLLPALAAGLAGTLLNNAVYWGVYKLAGIPHTLLYILGLQPVSIAYNLLFVMILHLILRRGVIRHRKDREYKGGFKEAKGFIMK